MCMGSGAGCLRHGCYEATMPKVVKHHTLHLMRQMTQKIQRATAVDDDQRLSELTWCEHYIDVVENLEVRWKTDEQLNSCFRRVNVW